MRARPPALHSIRARLLLWSGVLTAVALIVAWVALSTVLSDLVTRRLQAELAAAARGVMAAAVWDEGTSTLRLDPPPADPRFERPLSGWYWQVADGVQVLARAPALVGGDFGPEGRNTEGPDGAALIAHREDFTAPGDGRALTVTVTLPAAAAEAELAAIRRLVALTLLVLGAALLAAQGLAVRAGLLDLERFARAVAAVRDGKARTLPPPAAAELAPLAAELDRLIAAQAVQVERARAHAADLAHALKTPLAVLANRARTEDAPLLDRMDRIIRWHLKRARAAAGFDPTARAAVAPVLEEVALVMGPAARRRGLTLTIDSASVPDFRGDAEDLAEILGALVENAVKWARSTVRVAASGAGGRLLLEIVDDGPGIPAEARTHLLTRGARFDESAPGHGLGLAIAADRIRAYGGCLALEDAPGGGLLARVTLPA